MMPDRYLDQKSRKPSPYAKKKQAALPKPSVSIGADPGQVQPSFAESSVAIDPMLASVPQMPNALRGSPPNIGLRPGAENVRSDQYGQSLGREKQLNVYQDPVQYETNLATVANAPMMKELAGGIEQMKQLRADFLKTAPTQTDLSPVMALADYLAKGKGTAASGYRRPASYEDAVASIHGMLDSEQKARQNLAQLEFEQAGGLKSGTEGASTKTESASKADQGFKIPHPQMGMVNVPFTQAQGIGGAYEKAAHDVNEKIKNAQYTRSLLANPNWYTSNALKGSIVQGIGVQRLTQNELFLLGQGSQAWVDQFNRAIQKAQSGDALLPSDRHIIEQGNERMLAQAVKDRDEIQRSMGAGYNGITVLNPNQVTGVMKGRDTPLEKPPSADNEDSKALDFARKFFGGSQK